MSHDNNNHAYFVYIFGMDVNNWHNIFTGDEKKWYQIQALRDRYSCISALRLHKCKLPLRQ